MARPTDVFNETAAERTPFLDALDRDDAATLDDLLTRQPFLLMERHAGGEDALHMAIRTQKPACLEVLLEWGADPNTQNTQGRTALHYAAQKDDRVLFKRLLEKGGNPDIGDSLQITPAHLIEKKMEETRNETGLRRLIKKESLKKPEKEEPKPGPELKSRFLDPDFQKKLGKLFG